MDNKKDIGKLYKEHLDSLESKPNDTIWDALEEQLKKDNKKIVPFWLKLTSLGVLVLLISLTFYQLNTPKTNTTEETKKLNKSANTNKNGTQDNITFENDTLNTITKDTLSTKEPLSSTTDEVSTNQENGIKHLDPKTSVASQQNTNNKSTTVKTNSVPSSSAYSNSSSSRSYSTSSSNSNTSSSSNYSLGSTSATNTLLNTPTKRKKLQLDKSSILAKNTLKPMGLKSIDDLRLALNLIPFSMDSDEKPEVDITSENYSIETFAGPLLFSAPNNSSLDNRLNENKKSGNISFNYGAAIRFKLSEKTSIRLGIAKTDLVFVTENVTTTNEEGNILSLNNILGLDLDFNALDNLNMNNVLGGNSSIDLRQEYSYLEIPVEVDYRLIDKKINIDVFGGISLLALNNNTIYAQSSNGEKVEIGKANNLNKANVSLNTGTNFSTRIFKNIDLNLRPTFKYYFKTIGKSNIKFNPFTFGVNVGLSYSF